MKIKNLMWLLCLVISKLSFADCFDKAESYYHIYPDYLRAIARQEPDFNPHAKNKNKDGSFNFGVMQINSKTFNAIKNEYPTLSENDLNNHPFLNIHLGAMILTRNFATYGKNWLPVGMYNAGMKNTNTSIKNCFHYAKKNLSTLSENKSGKNK